MKEVPITSRRGFLKGVIAGGSVVITTLLSIPAIGFLLSPLFTKNSLAWARLALLNDIPYDQPTPYVVQLETGSGWQAQPVPRVVYAYRRHSGELKTFSNVCTHMQCDVHWSQALGQFLCPCHGGLYDINGTNVGGPPPSPLPEWVHRIRQNAAGEQVVEVANQLNERI